MSQNTIQIISRITRALKDKPTFNMEQLLWFIILSDLYKNEFIQGIVCLYVTYLIYSVILHYI